MQRIAIKNPHFLDLSTPDNTVCTGGNQEWYKAQWHKMSGCGPVAASNLVWYQARSQRGLGALCDIGNGAKSDFIKLMDKMFTYITPGKGGIHSSKLFIPGMLSYCEDRGMPMKAAGLEIPRMPRREPARTEVFEYLSRWLSKDCPVAFLNLSNGSLVLPDSWHWVTILALEPESMTALISDESRTYKADIAKWLETSILGGAFVTLYKP